MTLYNGVRNTKFKENNEKYSYPTTVVSRERLLRKKKSGEIVSMIIFTYLQRGDNAHIKTQSGIKQNLKNVSYRK